MEIGITERGDAALDLDWVPWVERGKPAILITKDPQRLHRLLQDLFNGIVIDKPRHEIVEGIIVHATITGYGGTVLEPHVPKPSDALEGYEELCKLLGFDRVVLRVDPVIPTDEGIKIAKAILERQKFIHSRARISFIDNYTHVKERLKAAGTGLPWESFHAPLELRKRAWEELGKPETCGEPGFECCGCVSEVDCGLFGIDPLLASKGQRKFCSYLANKTELLSNRKPCPHGCLYCYWK